MDSDTAAGTDSEAGGNTDTGGDSGSTTTIPCEDVRFVGLDGTEVDHTEDFTSGAYVTLTQDGTLFVCPGVWYTHLILEASVDVVGLGEGPEDTLLSGGESGSVVVVEGIAASSSVENLSIDRGATEGTHFEHQGGGVTCKGETSLHLNAVILSNHFAYDGSGLYASDGCSLVVEDVDFVDNQSEDDGGHARLENAQAEFRAARFQGGLARDCGALFLDNSIVSIQDSIFEGNTTTDSQGGGILSYGGTLTVQDSVFEGNMANSHGGGLSLLGDTTLQGVLFVDNETSEGGGGVHLYADHGTLTCSSCSFSGNQPDDVSSTHGGSYLFGEEADFTCDLGGCR